MHKQAPTHHPILDHLNDAQLQAVTAPLSNLLILAGPGCGKTRTLTHRIAWLVQQRLVSPYGILAVTFTNKAANEMRVRIQSLLGMPVQSLWVSTFHGFCHRFLRLNTASAGLPENFQILDAEDQMRFIRRIHKALSLEESKYPVKQSQAFINKNKQSAIRPDKVDMADQTAAVLKKVYTTYQTACQASGLIDFADLLLITYETLMRDKTLLAHYQARFQCLFVDEFQDTNPIQYKLLKCLYSGENSIVVLCDEDQSIYGFRGAKISHIMSFEKDFPNTTVIRLEQNYRSTEIILKAANHLIGHNTQRLGKHLWTQGHAGDKLWVFNAYSETDEARFVGEQIKQLIDAQGLQPQDIAILYRSNAQSRPLEEVLRGLNMPYQIYGGQKFFERAEIKDALGYLRLVANCHDDAAFERVINMPTRGIGNTTLNALRTQARSHQTSLWCALEVAMSQPGYLPSRSLSCLAAFREMILGLRAQAKTLTLSELTRHLIKTSGLSDHFKKDKTEKGQSRLENLEELISATHQFFKDRQEKLDHEAGAEDQPPQHVLNEQVLHGFLAHVALEAGEAGKSSVEGTNPNHCIQLMTLHAAKGLEFKAVFLTGLEEGLSPHKLSVFDKARTEEERRLVFVGMTRAKRYLYLSHAETRNLYGRETFQTPSRFLLEIPPELIQPVRMQSSGSAYRTPPQESYHTTSLQGSNEAHDFPFELAQRVAHPKFGVGTVLSYEGRGEHARIQIQFERAGLKWLIASYANLSMAEG